MTRKTEKTKKKRLDKNACHGYLPIVTYVYPSFGPKLGVRVSRATVSEVVFGEVTYKLEAYVYINIYIYFIYTVCIYVGVYIHIYIYIYIHNTHIFKHIHLYIPL
jgi:hypothetical protein